MSAELQGMLELLGKDATLKLVEAYGGVRCLVPKRFPAEHELLELLGAAAFALLHQYYGGSIIAVPLAKRWRIRVYKERGLTTKEIARRTGYTERAVARIVNNNYAPPPQFELPL